MGKALKCDLCEKQATVHLTQILNNKVHKVDLCESCAEEKGVTDPSGFSLADLLAKGAGEEEPGGGQRVKCPSCGYTQSHFRKTGRLGCPECYRHFKEVIQPILGNMHKGTSHFGKVPEKAREIVSRREELSRLEDRLQDAIKAERYEDAAQLRDRIQEIKSLGDRKESF